MITVNRFVNMHILAQWLGNHDIDFDGWGRNGSKSLLQLWRELEAGEVQLNENPPLRVVNVVQIIIRRDGHILVEAEQEFFNGQRRFRNQPPSEKIKADETVQAAAYRCLREELGAPLDNITLLMEKYQQYQANTNSISYPGLPSQYNFHLLEAAVSDLPGDDFWRENLVDGLVDPVKRHRWTWQPAETVKLMVDQ